MRYGVVIALALLSALGQSFATELPIKTVENLSFLGGGLADTFVGYIDGNKYMLKPTVRIGLTATGDKNESCQGNPESELICLPIMKQVGLVAPKALLFKPGPAASPTLAMGWVDEKFAGTSVSLGIKAYKDISRLNQIAFARMFIVDMLTANPDRHLGNFFVYKVADDSLHPIPIDHNGALLPNEWEGKEEKEWQLSVDDVLRLSCHYRKLTNSLSWRMIVKTQVEFVMSKVTEQFLKDLVDQLPTVISIKRKVFLKNFLVKRRSDLSTVIAIWAKAKRHDRVPPPVKPEPGKGGPFQAKVKSSAPPLKSPLTVAKDLRKQGRKFSWKDYWAELFDKADFSIGGPYLIGWEGPLDINSPEVGMAAMQRAGFEAHPAARILFERFANGPFSSTDDVMKRVSANDLGNRLIVLPNPPTPPLPSFARGRVLLVTATVPDGALKAKIENGFLELVVAPTGFIPLHSLQIPVIEDNNGKLVMDVVDDTKLLKALKALKIKPAQAIPRWLSNLLIR